MRIVFVRHGEPDYARDCLTELGRVQAKKAAQRLLGEGIGEIYASPLGRARETAQAAAEVLGLPVKTLDFMEEVRWGSADGEELYAGGHPWAIADEMARQGMELNRADWRDAPWFRTNRVVECVDRVERGIDEWLAGFGYLREGKHYRHAAEEEQHKTVALFSHGGSSCAAMGHILGLPFPYAIALLHLDFTGITVVRLDSRAGIGAIPQLKCSNDTAHLRDGQSL